MTDDIKKLLDNPATRLAEEIAAARLRHAKITLGQDWGLRMPQTDPKSGFSPDVLRKLAGE